MFLVIFLWKDDRVDYGAPLLREYTGDRIEGSNPSLSVLCKHKDDKDDKDDKDGELYDYSSGH